MKFSDITEKVKSFFHNISWDKIKEFFLKNWRYFAAAVLFILLVLVMVKCGSDKKAEGGKENTASVLQEYKVDEIPEVNELITNYYNAYAAGDLETLSDYATPISSDEQSFITMFSQYVESYQNIKCYTKPGLDETSYLVSVYLEVKFAGVDTAAPGLEFFYVRTNEEGKLFIDNLYSNYNRLNKEQETDSAISDLIHLYEAQEDAVALQAEVQAKYEEAIASDENLANLVNVTIKEAYGSWAASLAQQPAEEQPQTEQPTTEQPATEQSPEEQPAEEPAEQPPVTETVYATTKVNIRQDANETATLLGTAEAGTAFTRTATTEDGWSCVDYNGTPAYIKSDYLSTEAPVANETPTVDGLAEGTVVNLTDTVNVRSSMSETASKVGVAYAGDSVTVVMSYSEGWTKVNWKNKTGYVKTELLK